MSGDSNLYIARVLTYDPATKDTQILIPQLQGSSPLTAQAYINRYEELEDLPDLVAGERVLVFFDGGDTNSQAYWMVVYAGIEGPPGEPGPPGPGGGEIGDHVSQPDPHTQYALETAVASTLTSYYTKIEADAEFLTSGELVGGFYTQEQVNNLLLDYLHKAGGTMSGYITLHASPIQDRHPATKIYVDNHINAVDPHPLIQLQLGVSTTGNYVASIQGTVNQISVSGSGSETAAVTLSLPQNIDTLATPTFKSLTLTQPPGLPPFNVSSNTVVPNLNASTLQGKDTNFLLDWTNFINKPDPIVTVSLSGALSGSGTTTWTDMFGNLVVNVAATLSTGSGSNLNADLLDSLDSTYFLNAGNLNAGYVLAARLNGPYTFNLTGTLTGNASSATKLATTRYIAGFPFDGTANVTLASLTAGNGMTTGQYNGSGAVTFAVDGTALNTASKVVMRDASGNFAAGAITATGLSSPALTLSLADGGLPPMTVTSRVKVNNLNVDLLDGKDSLAFANREEVESLLGDLLYVGVYDAAAYTPVNRYFPFNRTTPNTITGWIHDPPVDASVDLRCDCTIPTVTTGNQRPVTGQLIINFSPTTVTMYVRASDATFISRAVAYTAIPGWPPLATPAVLGARAQFRAVWDATLDRLTCYWRPSEPGIDLLDDQVDPTALDQAALRPWKQIGAVLTAAGKTHDELATAQTLGGQTSYYYTGNIYRVATKTNGVVSFDMSASNAATGATTFTPTVGTTLTMVGAGLPRPEMRPTPDWSGGPGIYRDGMYWVVGSIGILDFIDSDLSGRYTIDDRTVTARQGDWVIAVNNGFAVTNKELTTNVATLTLSTTHTFAIGDLITVQDVDAVFNGTYTVTATTTTTVSYAKTNANVVAVAATGRAFGDFILKHMVFQYIQFSAETFVKSQILEHSNQLDPHPVAGYIRKTATDSWYAPIDHNHNAEIAQYVQQHTERTVYSIVSFSAVGPTGGAEYGTLTLKLSTAQLNFFRGSEVSVAFPTGSFVAYNGIGTVQTIDGDTITINSKGPTRVTTPGPTLTGAYTAKLTAEPHADYLLISSAEQTYAKAEHDHDADIAAAIALHATPNTDPHPEYLNLSRAALRYEVLGSVNAHIGDQEAHRNLYYTKSETDSRYSSAALLKDHLEHPDPHPKYLLEKEADDLFSNEGHNHDNWYFRQEKVLELISEATPKNILATDGAASARVFLGNVMPADPKPGDLWIQSDPVSLQPPVPPVGLAAIALSSTEIHLSWSPWPESSGVTAVSVQMSPSGGVGSYVTLTPPPAYTATTFDITGLAEDTRYWFRVTAVNAASNPVVESRNWGYVDLFTQNLNPPVPAGVAISSSPAITPTTFRLSWTQPAPWPDMGAVAARYEVALSGTTPTTVPAGNLVGTTGYYNFTGLTEVTSYQPAVRSVDRSGLRSAWVTANATTTNAVPPPPGIFTSITKSTTTPTVTGTWTKYAGTIPDFSHYEVELTAWDQSWTILSTTTTGLTWTTPDTGFDYNVLMRVRTVDLSGAKSGWTLSATVVTKTAASATVTVSSSGGSPNDQMTVTWTAVTGLDNFSGYEVVLYRAGVVAETADVATNVTSRSWVNLSWGTSYSATVRAKRSAGTQPPASAQATARTMLGNPVPGIDAGGSGQTVYGTLYAPAMPSTGAPNMAVELWYRGGNHIATQWLGAGTVGYRWDGLPWATGYSTRVITTRADGYQWGSWSGWAQADTGPVPDSTPPALPTGLDCHPHGSYGAWHAWMNWPGDSVGCHIDRLWSGAGYWENMYAGPPTSGFHLGTGAAGQSMQFRARSHDAAGNWSGYAYSNTYTLAASPMGIACINTNTWRPTNGGEYNADGTKRPIQGYYTNASWNAVGMFYYGDNIRNACAGKTVVGMRVLMIRYNGGGASAGEPIQLMLHDDAWDPGRVTGWGSPNGYLGWTPGTLAWNEVKWFGVNNFHYFWAGGARGFCVYQGGGKPYVVLQSVDANGYQGAVEIDHYG